MFLKYIVDRDRSVGFLLLCIEEPGDIFQSPLLFRRATSAKSCSPMCLLYLQAQGIVLYINTLRQDRTLIIRRICRQTQNDLVGPLDKELRIERELIGDIVANDRGSYSARAAVIITATPKVSLTFLTKRTLTYGMTQGSNSCPLTTTVYGKFEYGSVALKTSVLPAAVFAPAN